MKQTDPVNCERVKDPWRKRLFDFVGVLIRLRKLCPSLCHNRLDILNVDFEAGRRVITWKRDMKMMSGALHWPVVVVTNFSGEATPGYPYHAGD